MTRSDQQVLITGCYRSGTEYLTLLLNNHPELTATMYVVGFMRFCYGRYDPIEDPYNHSKLLFDAAHRIRYRWNRRLDVESILETCASAGEVTYALLYDLMMQDLFLRDGCRRWAEKTQLVWTKIPAFLELFPDGKVIHVVRDPRNVLASFKRFTYAPPPAYLGAVFNCLGSMEAAREYTSRVSPDRYHLLRFEDLLTAPETTLEAVFGFLELSAEHDLLAQEGWTDAKGNPWRHNSAFLAADAGTGEFDKAAALRRWDSLAPWEAALAESICAGACEWCDYGGSGASSDWPRALRSILSDPALTDWLKRWALTGEGVEQFPADPQDRRNWSGRADA